MERSDSSCDFTHVNDELPMKIEKLNMSDNEEAATDDYSDISLRFLDITDVDDCMEWFSDDKVNEFLDVGESSKKEAMRYIADVVIPHPWFRAICLNGKPIGAICVEPFDECDGCIGAIAYALASKYWGKGIATKAVKMAAATVFIDWPLLERLEAVVDVDNSRSQRVLEKAGFTKEGVLRKSFLFRGKLRDMFMFSLLSTDPRDQVTCFATRITPARRTNPIITAKQLNFLLMPSTIILFFLCLFLVERMWRCPN